MLTKLTKQQETLMYEVRDQWFDWIFFCNTKLDKLKAKKFVEWLYKLSNLPKPEIIFATSSLDCQFAANMLQIKNKSLKSNNRFWNKVLEHKVLEHVENLIEKFELEVSFEFAFLPFDYDLLNQILNKVQPDTCRKVFNNIARKLEEQLHIEEQVEYFVNGANMQYFDLGKYKTDFDCIAFCDFFERIGVIKSKDFFRYKKFVIESGIYYMIQFDKQCIVCDMPVKIKRDEQNRLHCDNHYAIEWKDGFGLYFLHGRCVPEKLIKSPGSITKKKSLTKKMLK